MISEDLVYSTTVDTLSVEALPENDGVGIVEGPGICLEQGNYTFAFGYNTDSQANIVQLVSDTSMDKEGNVGVVYAESALDPQQERVRLDVEFEQDATNLHVRVLFAGESLKIETISCRNYQKHRDPIIFYLLYSLLVVYSYFISRYQKKNKASRLFNINCLIFISSF